MIQASVPMTIGESGMAYIKKRGEYWRAEVRRKGHKPTYRTFDSQVEAQKWARRVESEMDTGYYTDHSEAERTTLRGRLSDIERKLHPRKNIPNKRVVVLTVGSNTTYVTARLPTLKVSISRVTVTHGEHKAEQKIPYDWNCSW